MAGLSSVFHQGKVYLMDASKFVVDDSVVAYEGKIDAQTQLPMIEIQALEQPRRGLRERLKKDVDRAKFVNKAGHEQEMEIKAGANNIPDFTYLSRTYSPFGTSAQQNGLRYHGKLNHIGTKVVERTLKAAGISYEKPRRLCEVCGLTKVKSHNHIEGSFAKEEHWPGDLIVCETVGPLSKSMHGFKWWVLLKDRVSTYHMSFVATSKALIGDCVMEGLKKFSILSGKKARRIQMDGDGSYTSVELKNRIADFGTLASWSSPYDHQQNGCAEKNVHTQYTDACVAMKVSGAPKDMWPEAVSYADFTRNNVRSVRDGSQWSTPKMMLVGEKEAFPPDRMLPFGCKIIVQWSKEQSKGAKSLVQPRAWIGTMVGYGDAFGYGGAYRVYRPEGRKIFHVSFNRCVADEGSFPWKMRKEFVDEKERGPLDWNPTWEALLDPTELERYGLEDEEVLEVADRFQRESKEDAQLSRESACPVEELPGEESQDVGIHLGGDVLASKDPVEEGHVSVEQDIVPVELGESLEGFLEAERQGEHGGNVEQKEQSHEWSGRLREGTHVDYAEQPERARNLEIRRSGPRPKPIKGYIEEVTEMKMEDDGKYYKIAWESGEKEWVKEYPLRNYRGRIAAQMTELDKQAKTPNQPEEPMALLCESKYHPVVVYLSVSEPACKKGDQQDGDGRIVKKPGEPIPQNRAEMHRSPYRKGYYDAECIEMDTHKNNGTWELVPRSSVPAGVRIMPTRWVYDDKTEIDSDGVLYIAKFKARLTAMGNFQKPGVDFSDTFASVMRAQTFRILLLIRLLHKDHRMEKWDAKAAFINAPLDAGDEIYIEQPKGHVQPGTEHLVGRLVKALYGLHQASRVWQKYLKEHFIRAGFKPYYKDEAVYYRWTKCGGGYCIVGTHVDDMVPGYNEKGRVLRDHLWKVLCQGMRLVNEGDATWVLKTQIIHDPDQGVTKISQTSYTEEILLRFGYMDAKPVDYPGYDQGSMAEMAEDDYPKTPGEAEEMARKYPFRELLGCLWWLAIISRSD